MILSTGRHRFLNAKGMMLLEVLLSVVILAVGIVIIYRPLLAATSALYLSDNRMEADRLLSFKRWELARDLLKQEWLPIKSEMVVGKRKTYDYRMQISPLTEDGLLQKVTHELSWREGGRIKNVKRDSFILVSA